MRLQVWTLLLAGMISRGVEAQTLGNASLNGKFYFVSLMVTAAGGQAIGATNASGAITFDGIGAYQLNGEAGSGSAAPVGGGGSGTYTVAPSGTVTLTVSGVTMIQPRLQIVARLSGDGSVLIGNNTEAADNTNDLFVAIRAPSGTLTNAVLSGSYTGASLELPNGQSASLRTALISISANGSGQFPQVTVVGHAVDQGSSNVSQSVSGATYTVNGDGTGTANFGSAASLFSGARQIFVSQDGSYIIGDSTAAGGRGLFIATRNFSSAANTASFNGRYWIAELTMANRSTGGCSSFDFEGASGAVQALGAGAAIFSERIHVNTSPVDFTGLNYYSVNADSTGALAPFLPNSTNMALGVPLAAGSGSRPNTVIGAQIGDLNTISCDYGIFFAVRAPSSSLSGSAPSIDPAGVVNAASFAPFPNPVAPGAILSLFGANLASGPAKASGLPLPVALNGVSVVVNGIPAPLYYISPAQINFQAPFEATGSTASILVINNGVKSNMVTVPLAPTTPGLLQLPADGDPYRAAAQHADGTPVSAAAPAAAGETIVFYGVGLGALQPAVATGAVNPAAPPATVADSHVMILIGGELATNVSFIGGTPNSAGLYQINVQIPATVLPGANVPVEIITSNADSDIVDIPVGS